MYIACIGLHAVSVLLESDTICRDDAKTLWHHSYSNFVWFLSWGFHHYFHLLWSFFGKGNKCIVYNLNIVL